MLDGVYRIQNDTLEFCSVRTPTAGQFQALLNQIITRIMKALTRHGALIEEEGMIYLAEIETDVVLAPLQSAACTYRIALGPRTGQKVLTLKTASTQSTQPSQLVDGCCVNANGFSLHTGVRCAMNQRKELEHLCCYITRPAIANERLTLKTPYQDGTTHIVMSPLEFMQRQAAFVPRPRFNLIRFASFRFAKYLLTPFHGVLAPNAKLRAEIISDGKKGSPSDANGDAPHSPASVRIIWARLLKRVFDIDINQCPRCGRTMKIIAAILEKVAINKILDHLGLPVRASPRAPAQIFGPFEPT